MLTAGKLQGMTEFAKREKCVTIRNKSQIPRKSVVFWLHGVEVFSYVKSAIIRSVMVFLFAKDWYGIETGFSPKLQIIRPELPYVASCAWVLRKICDFELVSTVRRVRGHPESRHSSSYSRPRQH